MQQPAQIESMCDSRLHTALRSPDRTRPRVPLLFATPLSAARRWLSQLPFISPLEQGHAALLQAFLLGSLLTGALALVALGQTTDSWALVSVLAVSLLALALVLIRNLRASQRRPQERSLERDREQSCQMLSAPLAQQAAELDQTGALPDERRPTVLSTPLQPILPGVLLAPLIGSFDNQRMLALIDQTFEEVERNRARHIIFDLSAMPALDPASAAMLLRLPGALRHLDTELIVVGLCAQAALTLCRTGIDLGGLRSYRSLQEALHPLLVEYAQTWPVLSYRLSADLGARTENN